MIKMKNNFVILLAVIIVYACSSENTTSNQQTDNFYALTVGNSWEYKYYLFDTTTDDFLPTPVTETVDITESVIINNNTYYNFKHIVTGNDGSYNHLPNNGETNFTLRDSLGFLIDEIGIIKYNNSNNDEYFVDHFSPEYSYYLSLSGTEHSISINVGSFTCYDNHYYLKDLNGNISNSLDHIYREDGKGEILSTLSISFQAEPIAEKRLESYSLQ